MASIVSFPTLYPDEDYRSVLHRYHLRSPNSSYLNNRKELIGKASNKMIMYPENLIHLANQLGVSHDFVKELLYNHTFYPIFRPFYSEQLNKECEDSFYFSGTTRNSKLVIATTEKQFVSDNVRYCPVCLNKDFEAFGESYLHRAHQFAFLSVCPTHKVSLLSRCPKCHVSLVNANASKMLVEPLCKCGHVITEDYPIIGLDCFISEFLLDIQTLMTLREASLNQIHQKLMSCLGNRGYIHYKGGHIYKKNLISDMLGFYSIEKLDMLGMTENYLYQKTVFTPLLKKENLRRNIPIYLLLMRFLSGSVNAFFEQNESYSNPLPFGAGPWLCVNYFCPYYNERVITDCKRKAHEWVTGVFSCTYCGMVYTRSSSLGEEDENLYSIDTMGSLFISTIINYYNQGFQLATIAELVNSNRTTVRKYLKLYRHLLKIEHEPCVKSIAMEEFLLGQKEVAATKDISKLEQCKKTVLEAIQIVGKGATRPQIKNYNKHRYDWVMKRDKNWMEEHLPPRKRLPSTLNLETLDDELYEIVKVEVEKVWSNPPKVRIGKSHIFDNLPGCIKSRCNLHHEFLPKTSQLIEQSLESKDKYLIRSFPEVIKWFKGSRYRKLSLKLLQNRFKGYKSCSSDVIQWVEQQIKEVNKW